jgi:hypothetical protein
MQIEKKLYTLTDARVCLHGSRDGDHAYSYMALRVVTAGGVETKSLRSKHGN